MKLGILSDTHGSLARTLAAIEAFGERELGAICHCGDIGSEAVLVELSAAFEPRGIPVYVVKGNVDLFSHDFVPGAMPPGVEMLGLCGELELAGKRLAIAHGHDARQLDAAVVSGDYAYVFTGHTHVADDRRIGGTRLINPGACYRSSDPSVAILDLDTDDLRYLPLQP